MFICMIQGVLSRHISLVKLYDRRSQADGYQNRQYGAVQEKAAFTIHQFLWQLIVEYIEWLKESKCIQHGTEEVQKVEDECNSGSARAGFSSLFPE